MNARSLRAKRRSLLRYGLALVLIAPAVLLGAFSTPSGIAAPGFPPVRPGVESNAALELERTRLDAVFARHYDIPIDLATRIHEAARGAGLDPVLGFGLVATESSFRRTAVSWAGAVGYTQLMPATARWMDPRVRRGDLFETETNLEIGFQYLAYLLDYYDGDVRLALTAYNRGPGTVDGLLEKGRDPENGYADKVLGTDRTGRAPLNRRS